MALPIGSERLCGIRDDARVLLERTAAHEHGLEALVAAADLELHDAEAALSDALSVTRGDAELHTWLAIQVQRSQAGAQTVRQLWAGAHEQHVAAELLLARLDTGARALQGREQRVRGDGVLVVDDYGDIRDAIAELLRDAGYVVRTAANGLEGLLAAYEMQPGVIVMDLNMPVLDGLEATRLIKANQVTRAARVIAYTGNPPVPHDPAAHLFAAVIQKPATPKAVLAAVHHAAGL
jgi:CheY-like chemotaxis protein